MTQEEIGILVQAMQRRLAAMPKRLRLFTTETERLPDTLLLTGARGCGKSTFLLHHSRGRNMLYVSVDNPTVVARPLYEVVSAIFMQGYEGVILDEVHYAANWSLHLKALCDDFPGKRIWASDSSALVLRAGTGDLSRRYVPLRMPLMSLREFIHLETGKVLPLFRLGDAELPAQPDAELLSLFRRYRQLGTRPFYQQGDYEARYMAVMDKVLNTDIPFFLPSVTDNNLRLMRAIVGTLATSSVPRVQVTSLCNDWGIGAEKLYQLLFVMEQVGLLRVVRYQGDTKAKSVGAKMLFADPCAYGVLHADEGTEREAYVAHCFAQAGYTVEAMREERQGDFVVSRDGQTVTLEVGGRRKKPKESDYVLRDNTDYPSAGALPFWLMGMMW